MLVVDGLDHLNAARQCLDALDTLLYVDGKGAGDGRAGEDVEAGAGVGSAGGESGGVDVVPVEGVDAGSRAGDWEPNAGVVRHCREDLFVCKRDVLVGRGSDEEMGDDGEHMIVLVRIFDVEYAR